MASPAPPFPDAPAAPPCCPDAPAAPPCSPDGSPAMEAQATLPDHLIEDILLRLPTAADLARASMAGPSLRRIVADHAFLRRFRALHPPPLQDMPDLIYHWELFLAPASAGGDIAADAPFRFRVMCLAQYQNHLVLVVWSSSPPHAAQWHAVRFDGWSALVAGISDDARSTTEFGKRYYAHKCFCWAMSGINRLLMLDIGAMEFSSVNLPPGPRGSEVAFVEAREGRLGMFTISFSLEDDAYYLWYTILVSIEDDPRQWQTEGVFSLPHDYCYFIIGVAGGYLLLNVFPEDLKMPDPDYFSLNLQTMKLERFCGASYMMSLQRQLYAGFPPFLSPPTI